MTLVHNGATVDLNCSRSHLDQKLYRLITLPNGLKCVLISDTKAMRMRLANDSFHHHSDHDSHEDESNDEPDDSESDSESDSDGVRKAATALLVNVGSYHDPPYLQGLAHFLEHMLFLGTEAFPGENQYDAFLAQHGGDDNAYTDMECTVYHYCIPQDAGQNHLWKALEMFSCFFKCPLLGDELVDRELNAVESEFELNKNDDDNRLAQLMAYTCGMDENAPIMGQEYNLAVTAGTKNGQAGNKSVNTPQTCKPYHPFAKFSWGNKASLKVEPESKGISIMNELRKFYHTHYYAKNMKLVVMAGYELDDIQNHVVQYFKDIPADPRLPSPTYNDRSKNVTNLDPYRLPFHPSSLKKIYRVVPVRHRHTLTLTWQIPSMCPHWRSKPANYLSHLLGHEASGSILSTLKQCGWAMGCFAGIGDDGQGDASSHALFMFQVSLSKLGVKCWREVVTVVFAYIGMLRYHFHRGYIDRNGNQVEGLDPWIYDELKSVAALSYRYDDEGDVTDIVEEVAENMAPWCNLPDDRLLDGDSLLFDDVVDNSIVKDLLFHYFSPENTRVDLMSSLFGRDSQFCETHVDEKNQVIASMDEGNSDHREPIDDQFDEQLKFDVKEAIFDDEKAGLPSIEPRFGTKFWVEELSSDILQQWSEVSKPQLPSPNLLLDLPPKNPYIPTQFELKPLPEDDGAHPLLNCSIKVCVTIGKKKSWFPAAVTQYKLEKMEESIVHYLLLSYEDEEKTWHVLDLPKGESMTHDALLESGYEGTLDKGTVKFRVIAVPREGEGVVLRYGDANHDNDVEDGIAFPPIPPPAPASRLPRLVYEKHSLKIWHLQDRKFKRPIADLRIKVQCDGALNSALNQGCLDLFCRLCADALGETLYLASTSDLESSISPTDTGFSIRINGFDHKLLNLTKVVLGVIFSGKDYSSTLPPTIKHDRFEACLESLRRHYHNSGLKSSELVTSLRLLCILPSIKSPHSKLNAMRNIDIAKFAKVMSNLLKKIHVDAIYLGNVTSRDAEEVANVIYETITANGKYGGIPKNNLPVQLVVKVNHVRDLDKIIAPSLDPKDPNTAVEVYFQMGKDCLLNRVLIDLLEHVLYEPLYSSLRTKQQLGYAVSCGARWTHGVLGMSFNVVTSIKSADEVTQCIDQFLEKFRSELVAMTKNTYMEHLAGLAKNKLEMFESLEEECSTYWSRIIEGRCDFEADREEALCLRSITKDRLLQAYDEWLYPMSEEGKPKTRRGIVVHVIGAGDGDVSLGRPSVKNLNAVEMEVDQLVDEFHTFNKETWGTIIF